MSQAETINEEDRPTVPVGTVKPFPELPRRDTSRTAILVFTRDATLIDTVRKGAPADAMVVHASDLVQVSEQLASQPDVLILDASCTDVPRTVRDIARQFPELVTIVAGRREESASLMKLTATGEIYRFLLVPLGLGQTRLTLEAALRRRVERTMEGLRPPESATPPPPEKPRSRNAIVVGALLLTVGAGAVWYFMQPDTSTPRTVTPQAAAPSAAATSGPIQAALALAVQAMERSQYVEPAGSSALDHYRAALALEANNAEAQAGIQAIADRMIGNAENALLAERLDQAVAAIELARNIQPDHSRLAFLDAQVQRERERQQLTQARDVNLRLRGILTAATQRMEAGQLLAPAGGSALDALIEARRIDASDPAVIQGFRNLTTRVLEEAQAAVNADQRDRAATLLEGARQLSPTDARIASLERSLTASVQSPPLAPPAVSTPATETGLARIRLAEGRLLDPAGDSARDHLLAARAVNAGDAEVQRLLAELKSRLVDSGRQSLRNDDIEGAERFLSAAADLNVRGNDDALVAARRDLDSLRTERDFHLNVVSARSLNRTRMIPPQYPQTASRRGIEGWVDLVFTVTTNGTVADISVTGSEPADVFNSAAIEAVRQWRFEPVVRAGSIVPQRAAIRIRFDLEN